MAKGKNGNDGDKPEAPAAAATDAPAQGGDVTQSEAGASKLDAAALQNTVDLLTSERNGLHSQVVTLERQLGELRTNYETAASRVVEVEQQLADAARAEQTVVTGAASVQVGEDGKATATRLTIDWGEDTSQADAAIVYAELLQHSNPDKARAIATSLANDVLPGVPNGDTTARMRARQLINAMNSAEAAERVRREQAQRQAEQEAATNAGDSFAGAGDSAATGVATA